MTPRCVRSRDCLRRIFLAKPLLLCSVGVLRGPYPGVMSAMEVPVVQLLSYGPSKLLTRPHLLPGMNE